MIFFLSFPPVQPIISGKSSTELIYTLYCALILISRKIITCAEHMWGRLWSRLACVMLAHVSMHCNWETVPVGRWGCSDRHSFQSRPKARVLGIFRVQFSLRKKYPSLEAACNYSFSSRHLLFSGSEVQEGCEKVRDASEESHNTNKIVVRLMREVRGLSSDENEVRPRFGLPMVFIWKPVRGWLLALREKGNAVGLAKKPMFILNFKNTVIKKALFNNLHRMSKMTFLAGLWDCSEAQACTYTSRLRKKHWGYKSKFLLTGDAGILSRVEGSCFCNFHFWKRRGSQRFV